MQLGTLTTKRRERLGEKETGEEKSWYVPLGRTEYTVGGRTAGIDACPGALNHRALVQR
jgi:hypothetical protein